MYKNGNYFPKSNVSIDDVIINKIDFGNLILDIDGNQDLTKYRIASSLTNKDVRSFNALGTIDFAPKISQLDLDVRLNDFNLQAISPFGATVITKIRGEASGAIQVMGNYRKPKILGTINLKNSGLKVPYLNTDFDLANSTQMIVSNNTLKVISTDITDTKFNTKGVFSGIATHDNYRDWNLNLQIEAPERLLVLDTPPDEDELYYLKQSFECCLLDQNLY